MKRPLTLRRARRTTDLESACALLRACRLPLEGVAENFEHFFVAISEGEALVGVVGLEICGAAGCLRSLAVAPEVRGSGFGRRLVDRSTEFAVTLGVPDLYLLTDTAADYFAGLGFRPVDRSTVPSGVRRSTEFTLARCADAAIMHRFASTALPYRIRSATREDLPSLVQLMEELTITHAPSVERRSDSPASLAEAFTAIDRDPHQTVLVAEVDGRVAGTATLIVIPNLSHRGAPWSIVENVIVESTARGRGIGRALLTAAIRRAREAGCYRIALTTNFAREGAHRLYEDLGFDRYGWAYRLDF